MEVTKSLRRQARGADVAGMRFYDGVVNVAEARIARCSRVSDM
jgi:hypothetical protein